jgi:aspartate kinase
MIVLKFGGTSVGTGERMLHVARIIQAQRERRPVVVTSAMSGVTDSLLALAAAAARGERAACDRGLAALRERHLDAARIINPDADWRALSSQLEALGAEVAQVLERRDGSAAARDALAARGELLAVTLLAGALQALGSPVLAWEAPVIATDDHFGDATPRIAATRTAARRALAWASGRPWDACAGMADISTTILVTPGFIGRTDDGRLTTLGRGGSDYAATLLAAALDAEACWIYTDVDGVFTADPRLVADAEVLPRISAAAAGRLSSCGAKVLHPRTVAPAARQAIELRVRNTFRPEQPGTVIDTSSAGSRPGPQALAGRRGLCAVGVVGAGVAEIPALFGRLCAATLDVQGEIVQSAHPVVGHDPWAIVDAAHVDAIAERLEREFAQERAQGLIEGIAVRRDLALCTLVGARLGHTHLDRAQRALAAEHIAPVGLSACPDALSFIIPETALGRAMIRLHDAIIKPTLRAAAERPDRPYLDGALPAGRIRSRTRRASVAPYPPLSYPAR